MPLSVLILEDSEDDALLLVHELERTGYDVAWEVISSEDELVRALDARVWDLLISDHSMPGFDSFRALAVLHQHRRDIPFLIVSGTLDEESAVACMRAGAHDFLVKGRLARLSPVVERALREAEMRRQRQVAEEALRESQEQFRQAQKMEAIGRLAGGITHDFNNLLTAIIGYSELIIGELPDDHPQRRDAEEIRAAGERAARLTRQLLVFSRQQVIETERVNLNDILKNLDHLLRRVIGEDIDVVTQVEEKLWPVEVDPGQMEQVVMNLAVNARDAMPEGGRLIIETANVELDEVYATHHLSVTPGPFVMLAVSDTGVGMSADVRTRVFEPFFTTKEHGKGTGLGLSTVYGIVRQCGGSIWIYSEVGRGATFKIYLPRAETRNETTRGPATAVVPAGSGKESILLVDDDHEIRGLVRRMLERIGYGVTDAETGSAAVALAESADRRFDLLITDLVLSDMGGRELADRLVAAGTVQRVLYFSGYTDHAVRLHDALDPGRAFLQKPFAPAALSQKVREVLTGAGPATPDADQKGLGR